MAWNTAGILTNPTSNVILADTGALPATPFTPTLMCWSTQGVNITFRHRNAANSADLHTQQMALSTEGCPFVVILLPTNITLGANERLTLTLDNAFVGQIQCSILTT